MPSIALRTSGKAIIFLFLTLDFELFAWLFEMLDGDLSKWPRLLSWFSLYKL
jgi:hypothetical protein